MSNIPLSNIEEVIETTLFERIRLECYDKGYQPDLANTGLYPNNPTGQNQWETDLTAIKNIKGFAIEVFNNSSSQARGNKKVPRIVISPQPFLEGALGGDSSRVYTLQNNGTFNATILPPQTSEYYCNIHLVANTAQQIRILQAIMSLALPVRGYIPIFDRQNLVFLNQNFFIRKLQGSYLAQTQEGIMEYVYRYQIPDIFEVEEKLVATGIAKINEITTNIQVQGNNGNITGQNPLVVT